MVTGRNLIAGEPIDSAGGRLTAGGALAQFEEASPSHVDQALEAAERAFHACRQCSAHARAAFLDRIAQEIENNPAVRAPARVSALPSVGAPGRTAGRESSRDLASCRRAADEAGW